jgi:hypothetical protein
LLQQAKIAEIKGKMEKTIPIEFNEPGIHKIIENT